MKNFVKFLLIGTAVLALTACEPGKFKNGNCNGSPPSFGQTGQGAGGGCDHVPAVGTAAAAFGGIFRVACGPETFTAPGADVIWVLDCKPVAGGPEYVYTPPAATTFPKQRISCSKHSLHPKAGLSHLPLKPTFHRLAAYDSMTFKKVKVWFIIDGGSKCDGADTVAPEDGSDVIPPAEESDDTVIPEDESGETVVPEDESGETVIPEDESGETVIPEDESDDRVVPADEGDSQATDNRARIEELIEKWKPMFPAFQDLFNIDVIENAAAELEIEIDQFDIDAWASEQGYNDLDSLETEEEIGEFLGLLLAEFGFIEM